MSRLFALVVIASSLMAMTMLAVTPSAVDATEPAPTNCGVVPIDLVLILDRSGSMNTSEGAQTRLAWAKQAASGLVTALDSSTGTPGDVGDLHRVGLTTFGNGSATNPVLLGAVASAATVNTAIGGISATGGTPFDLGMSTGAGNMTGGDRTLHDGVAVIQVFVFLSDGNPDPDSFTPDAGDISNYLAAVPDAADRAYAVAIGPDGGDLGGGGTGVSYALMRQIAKPAYVSDPNPGGFRAVTNGSGLPNLFAEIYQEIACPMGRLEVVKSLSPTDDPGRFDLSIGGTVLADEAGHNGTTGEHSLQAGPYNVAEAADGETSLANYATSISCLDGQTPVSATGSAPSWTVEVTDGADIVCTITNTRRTGTLTVTKVVQNNSGGGALCTAFGFKVNGGGTIPFEGDCSNQLTLPTGTYSVAEPAVSGYDTTYDNCAQVAVVDGQNATCTITNNDQPGTLIVVKDLDIDDGGVATCASFSFKVNGGSSTPFEGDCSNLMTVNAGTYSVVETDADGYTTSYANCTGLVIANGGSATCTITNDDEPATLIVNKVVSGSDLGCVNFGFKVNGGSATNFQVDCSNELRVDAGTYSVVENAAPDYDTTYDNCSQLVIPNGGSATCTITNTRDTGWLTVEKDLDPGDDPGLFDLLINGESEFSDASDGDSTGAVEVETGVNTVGEEAGSGTSLGNYSSSIECVDGGGEGDVVASGLGAGPLDVTVTDEADIVCTITNERVTVGFDKALPEGHDGTVEPGETISYTLTVHVNDGDATGVVVTDVLPDGLSYVDDSADPSTGFSANGQELEWIVGDLAEGDHEFTYDATVDADASGDLENLGCVDADQNHDFAIFGLFGDEGGETENLVCEETTVKVQNVSIAKSNDTTGPVAPGTVVDFTLTFDVTNGPIDDVDVEDQLPAGLGNVTLISAGGSYNAGTNRITWSDLDGLVAGDTLTYRATVSATATAGTLTNVATITTGPCVGDGCEDDSTVTVRLPTLTVTKSASTDTIIISGPAAAPVATPSIVTWTLSYTLANGPVTGAVITDAVPGGFVFLDAANGGTFAAGTVTWNLGTLTTSGSVSFRTTVDAATVSRAAPTVNTAMIDSNETTPDDGTDSVTVTVEAPPLGGTPTPRPALPNTATATGIDGHPVTVPVELLAVFFLGSLGTLAFANVRSRRR